MSYPLPKNPQLSSYLNLIREQNKQYASKCFYCNAKSIGISAAKEKIIFTCKDHTTPDNPNVVHRIYPGGMSVPKHMMDPNIGGHFGKTTD